jgi:hypothetical protein
MHLAYAFFDNALYRASPAGVKHADHFPLGVYQNHGQAVGGLNRKQQTGRCTDQPITGERLFTWRIRNRIRAVNDVGVDLAERNQRPEGAGGFPRTATLVRDGPNFAEKGRAVPFDGGANIVLGEAQIEIALAVRAGESAHPRREAMDKPGKPA